MLRENTKKLLRNAVCQSAIKIPLGVENHLKPGLVGIKNILFFAE
jgi:hypothetical protein